MNHVTLHKNLLLVKQFFQRNYFYAGFLFLGLALYEVREHHEITLLFNLGIAFALGCLFSYALCFRHNHHHIRKIIFIPLVVISNAIHVCVDATLLLSNFSVYGISAMVITLLIMLPHEILRQPAHIKTLTHEGVSLKNSIYLITGIYVLILASTFLVQIQEIPEWLHDMTIITYGFLAGEILWHERKNIFSKK